MVKKGVSVTHPIYDEYAAKWQMCRDAAGGESAVHEGTTTYLPELADEESRDYEARLARTSFFNATWRTVAGMRGLMMRKPPTLEIPAATDAYMDDVDMAGTPLNSFVQGIIAEALVVGRVGVLVDYPQQNTESSISVAQAASLGLRPSLKKYAAESIINWKTSRIGNVTVLSLVVLTEEMELAGDEFAHDTETRYRVLDLFNGAYRQRVYRVDERGKDEQIGEDVFPLMSNSPMSYIPFIFVGVDTVGPDVEEPPLIDLVDMNIHHYQVTADYEHGCHFSGLPTLFISGYQPDMNAPKIYIGGPNANCLPDPQAKAYFVEIASDFVALRNNLEDKKAQMAVLGARMLETQKSAVEAANTLEQRSKGEESQLAVMAQTISLGMSWILTVFSEWAGATGEVKYELQLDAGYGDVSAQELTAVVAAWQSGGISGEAKFNYLQKRDFYLEGDTYEIEQARTGDAGMNLVPTSVTGVDPQGGQMVADAMKVSTDQHNASMEAARVTMAAILAKLSEPVEPSVINVAAPDMKAVADAIASIPAPVVNVAAPIVNIPSQQQMPPIVVNTAAGAKVIDLVKDSAGNITGATVSETT
jgi:hypothetical protein